MDQLASARQYIIPIISSQKSQIQRPSLVWAVKEHAVPCTLPRRPAPTSCMFINCYTRRRGRLGGQAAGRGQMGLRYTEPRMAFESPRYPSSLVSDSRKGRNACLVSVPLSPLPPRLALHSASQRAVGSAVPIQEPTSQHRGPGNRQREQASPGRTSSQRTGGHASG